jgi:hypothetical protein
MIYRHIVAVFIGEDTSQYEMHGSTVLLELDGGKFLQLDGNDSNDFKKDFVVDGDTISHYYSQMGNNEVPYAMAVGDRKFYFGSDGSMPKAGNEHLSIKDVYKKFWS